MSTRRATFAPPAAAEEITLEALPELTPATADLLCWLWAATPPKGGRLDVARAAASLEVSDSTLRRWIKNSAAATMPAPARAKMSRLMQLAILRGRGQLLWPPLDRGSRERQLALSADAQRGLDLVRSDPDSAPATWRTPRTIYLAHYPRARCYGVASGSTRATPDKIHAVDGEIIAEIQVANRHAATLAKATVLEHVRAARCIPPRSLVPTGRTETWRHAHGPVDLSALIHAGLR